MERLSTSPQIFSSSGSRVKVNPGALLPDTIPEESIGSFDLSDKKSFTDVYNKLYPYAFFFAKRLVTSEDAADIVASVFGKLWFHKKKFENLPHCKAFLRVAVRNACVSHYRKQASRIRKEEMGHIELYSCETDYIFTSEEIGAEKLSRIYSEIERLPHRCKEIFKLAYLQNIKNSDIARILGITIRTVQNQKHTALKMLRMTLLSGLFLLLSTGIHLSSL